MRGIIIHFRYDTEESAYVDFICNRIGFFCGNYSNSCKMWFHLKLLFAKNMRKAERALAFRISGSKCPFLTYLLLRYSSKSFTNHRSDDHCNDHFAQIRRNERNDTDCKCVNLSMTIPAMIAIGINPMMYPPVGPASFASPPVNPENTGSPTNPSNR